MAVTRIVVNLGRSLRKREQIRVRQPLRSLTVVTRDPKAEAAVLSHTGLISEELNVKAVAVESDERDLVHLSAKANFKLLGPRFGSATKEVAAAIAGLSHDELVAAMGTGTLEAAGHPIALEEVVIDREPRAGIVVASEGDITIVLDTEITAELETEGLAREIVNRVQAMRREAGLDVSDRIIVEYETADATITDRPGAGLAP